MQRKYQNFYEAIRRTIPENRIITDPLERSAMGTDASFYLLIPKIIINVENEDQVQTVLFEARKRRLPVTFRAAGTSLSGQAVTDSILVRLGRGWDRCHIYDNARFVRVQPGLIGGRVNAMLLEFNRKIGPDPASIDTAKIGGILANNASGMCCGTAQNSYQTLESIRLILLDGTVVDTSDDKSVADFRQSHPALLNGISKLRQRVMADDTLSGRIRHKYKIKNTTGYSLNAFVDYEDPLEIMTHLMIGSEGTLAFIADAVFRTVVEHSHKASALVLFEDIKEACRAVPVLREQPVAAAELMDRASLASVEDRAGMPVYLKGLDKEVTALLIETRAGDKETLSHQIKTVGESLSGFKTVMPISFTDIPEEYQALWKIRKGLFPAVGAVRQTGTTVVIEDVAFPVNHLADAALDLQVLFEKHGYHEAIIFGHAFEGNLHFLFAQDFSTEKEVIRYRDFMQDVVNMVVDIYHGSLKAEHGTGRNMAPFVEKEWGAQAFQLMKEIKTLFDPENLLNPGVIFNADAHAHIHNLKPLPATHPVADMCIECGFCEPVCPSRHLSFTPRQRIAGRREISRQLSGGKTRNGMIKKLHRSYQYPAKDTCAADGLCGTRCPVEIDTGEMIKTLRQEAQGPLANRVAEMVGNQFGKMTATVGASLNGMDMVHKTAGTKAVEKASGWARKASFNRLPQWNRAMPKSSRSVIKDYRASGNDLEVVYFPSCASRAMGGPSRKEPQRRDLPEITVSILSKAGYNVLFPENLASLCCGQAFASKGFKDEGNKKAHALSQALITVSRDGSVPIVCDTSPCLHRMKETLDSRLQLFEPVEFTLTYLMDRLDFRQKEMEIAIHPTCSTIKMGLADRLYDLARMCATKVVWPQEIFCCGFAGDRGFSFPELNESALKGLAGQVSRCEAGYSTSKTCEIGLSLHGKIPYRSILYLVDEVTD